MTDAEFQERDRQDAIDNAVEALDRRARDLVDVAEKLKRRAAELRQHKDPNFVDAARPVDLFSWAINDIENMLRNLNFASAVRLGAKL